MRDSYNITLSPAALEDLRQIYAYIAFELLAPEAAKGQIDRIRGTVRSLNYMPTRYPVVDWEPWESMKMHKTMVDRYIAFYTIDDENMIVNVVRIVYGGRNIKQIAIEMDKEK